MNRQPLDGRRRRKVEAPTRNLVKQLERWADTAADTESLLGNETSIELPPTTDGADLAVVDTYCLASPR